MIQLNSVKTFSAMDIGTASVKNSAPTSSKTDGGFLTPRNNIHSVSQKWRGWGGIVLPPEMSFRMVWDVCVRSTRPLVFVQVI